MAVYYIDGVNGVQTNNGTSPSTPRQYITRVGTGAITGNNHLIILMNDSSWIMYDDTNTQANVINNSIFTSFGNNKYTLTLDRTGNGIHYPIPSSSLFKNLKIELISPVGTTVSGGSQRSVSFDNCDVNLTNWIGPWVDGSPSSASAFSLIRDCVNTNFFTDSFRDNITIQLEAQSNSFINCSFKGFGSTLAGSFTGGSGFGNIQSFEGCSFFDMGDTGNYIINLATNNKGVIFNNCSLSIEKPLVSSSASGNATSLIFTNNVVENPSSSPIYIWAGSVSSNDYTLSVKNNVLRNCILTNMSIIAENIITTEDTNWKSSDPLSPDFMRLKEDSPAIGFSTQENRDAGAFQSPPSPPPVLLPETSDVRKDVVYGLGALGDRTGVLDVDVEANLPDEDDVRLEVLYGSNNQFEGGLVPDAEANLPFPEKVLEGTHYGSDMSIVGILDPNAIADLPAPQDVRKDVEYGNEVVGTLDVFNEANLPNEEDVRLDVQFGNNQEGTLDIDAEANLPSQSDVRLDVEYGEGMDFKGELDIEEEANLPQVSDVRKDVDYGKNLQHVGILDVYSEANLPSENDVREDVEYGEDSKGTLNVFDEANLPSEDVVIEGEIFGDNKEGNFIVPQPPQVENQFVYGSPNNPMVGELTGGGNMPPEDKVLDGYEFGTNQVGSLGHINENELDISAKIRENALNLIGYYLPNFKRLKFTDDLEFNNSKDNKEAFGVQVKGLSEGNGTTIREWHRTITVVLRDTYTPRKNTSDANQQACADALRTKMEEIRRRFEETNAGSFASVMGTTNYSELDYEYNAGNEDYTLTITMDLDVIYSVKNLQK